MAVAPYIWTQDRPALRVLGAHQTLYEPIRQKAEQDLGFRIEYTIGEHAAVTHQAATQPQTFDIYEKSADYIEMLWGSHAIQPIEKSRIKDWESVSSLTKTGRVSADAKIGEGKAPYKTLNVLPGNQLGATPTDQISFLPFVHNVDSFGYLTGSDPHTSENSEESWSWLMSEYNRGKVGILIDPAVGFNELALAARTSGKVSIDDIGNMTREDFTNLVNVLIELKRAGHFAGFGTQCRNPSTFSVRGARISKVCFRLHFTA